MVANPATIVAMATPAGRGGIGIVRLSGGLALEIVSRIAGGELWPRYAHYRKFRDGGGNTIDEGVVIHFPAPGSYTGEQVVEMHAHGNRLVLARLIARAVELGARPARPGEFTERAFHNGRIDLVQAEAIADLIESASEQAARSAVRSLEGDFSRRVNRLLDTVIDVRAGVEGALDLPDEDADFLAGGGPAEKISACRAELAGILSVARQGTILNEGIIAVIAGRPNVGKSTLLNALAGREAAIVTASPGTTRDLIEQDIAIDGIPVRVVDTAGLRSAGDEAEQEGIRRALAAAVTSKWGVAGLKAAMDAAGRRGGAVRAPLLPVPAGAEPPGGDHVLHHRPAADQVLLDDALEHRRLAAPVPGPLRIDHRGRSPSQMRRQFEIGRAHV